MTDRTGKPLRVLVVEDAAPTRDLLVQLLNASGCEVVGSAPDGEAAVTLALRLRPDVITMDIYMPRLDGVSATRRIMAEVPTPIVVLSAGIEPQARLDFEALRALVRWNRPDHGVVSPADFIPLAEETGLILSIGEWVLREACRQTRVWQAAYPSDPPLSIAVNLSAHQFQQPALVDLIDRILRDTGLDPSSLILEITEGVAMEDAKSTIEALGRLHGLGVQLDIDDFGTGYSSLSYLKRFPVDTLKIDRTFVSGLGENIGDSAIVRATITLAHTLAMQVTAEGVENVAQLEQLRALGCDVGQGYYFARPLPSDEMGRLLASGRQW